jgi:protein TonB
MTGQESIKHKRPYRPPIGIPGRGEPRAQATVASIALHALIVLLILAPALFVGRELIGFVPVGSGGPGDPGGGGGGNRSFPGRVKFIRERVGFVKLESEAPAKPKQEPPVLPKPETPPPPAPPPPPPQDSNQKAQDAAVAAKGDSTAADSAGAAGAGTGRDGSAGDGPGRGGGVGSGVGTGRGSGTGPGTGGGSGTIYPPTVVALPILPLPIPSKVRPYKMVAQFEVDTLGKARLIGFNPSRDAGYNRRIREMLLEIRFRPAVTADGRPVVAIAVVTAEAM